MANLYEITLKFENGMEWKLKIAAVNAKAVTAWAWEDKPGDPNPVVEVNVKLVQKDFEPIDNPFFTARIVG